MRAPFVHLIGHRVAATLGPPPVVAGAPVNAIATGGTVTVDTPTSVEHQFTAGDTFALSGRFGLLPVTFTITGTASFGGVSSSGSANVTVDVAVVVTSGSVTVAYNPTQYFDPTTIFAHAYWPLGVEFRALALADGAQVATLPDEVGTADLTQATAGNRPIYRASAAAVGNRAAIDFDGSDDKLGPVAYSIALPNSRVVIAKFGNTLAGHYLTDGGPTNRRLIRTTGSAWEHYAGVAASGGSAGTTLASFVSKIVSGTSDVLKVNGSTITSATAGDQAIDGLTLGNDSSSTGAAFNGYVLFAGDAAGDIEAHGSWATFQAWALGRCGVTI